MTFLDVALIHCHIELTSNLRSRAFGGSEKVNKFCCTTSIVTLCYIGHHRHRCPADLILKSKISCERWIACYLVNTTSKLSGLLPTFHFFKFLKCSHCILLTTAEGLSGFFQT